MAGPLDERRVVAERGAADVHALVAVAVDRQERKPRPHVALGRDDQLAGIGVVVLLALVLVQLAADDVVFELDVMQ